MNTWDKEIAQLEDFFAKNTLPTHQIILSESEIVISPHRFVNVHFEILFSNKGNERYRSYLTRLQKFMNILIDQYGLTPANSDAKTNQE